LGIPLLPSPSLPCMPTRCAASGQCPGLYRVWTRKWVYAGSASQALRAERGRSSLAGRCCKTASQGSQVRALWVGIGSPFALVRRDGLRCVGCYL